MTDDHLRGLERQSGHGDSLEIRARWLLEKVRAGKLDVERLEIAAWCGHPASRLALSTNLPSQETPPRNLSSHSAFAVLALMLAEALAERWIAANPNNASAHRRLCGAVRSVIAGETGARVPMVLRDQPESSGAVMTLHKALAFLGYAYQTLPGTPEPNACLVESAAASLALLDVQEVNAVCEAFLSSTLGLPV